MIKRLPPQLGEWIDRSKPIEFTFEGIQYSGFMGDTITSALWANGEQVLGRSFKYHRARGILSFANHDVNVLVTDAIDTNIRADVVAISEGMQLTAVNTSGGVKRDRKQWLDKISALLPVGFYYKAFFKPRYLFPFWENIIRKNAGLGQVNVNFKRINLRKTYQHTDVLIIGAGASGLSAALHSASFGLKVVLVDENSCAGGSLNEDLAQHGMLQNLLQAVNHSIHIQLITDAYAAGYYTDHFIPIVHKNGMVNMRAKAVIVSTGAFEQPPVFRNNDLPGVMLSSAALRLVHRYSVRPFTQGIVFAANTDGYYAALNLLEAGIHITALVDLRRSPNEPLATRIIEKGLALYTGYCVYEAMPNSNHTGVQSAIICPYDEVNAVPDVSKLITILCDGIAMSAGWAPAAALLYQAGATMLYDEALHQFKPKTLPNGIFASGRVNGVFALEKRIEDGKRAANEAITYLGKTAVMAEAYIGSALDDASSHVATHSHAYPIVLHPQGKNFIDFDEDIQLDDFINAAQEGFDNIELMKRFTTVGMGPSQGKHANMNAIRILARIRNLPIAKVGSTTSRPFFHPTSMGHLAGRSFHPYRRTAIHTWHENNGAEFTQIGVWLRPAYYAKSNLTKAAAIQQEILAVHEHAGAIDISSLGKIQIHGAEAAIFLERFYTGNFADQRVGETRYALALDEAGVMMDEGIVARLSEQKFYVTSSTTNAVMVYREMQRWQQQWQLSITLINVTNAYAAINVAGPMAIKVLSPLIEDSFTLQTMNNNSVCQCRFDEVNAIVMRVGFVSHIAYEIHVSAQEGQKLWLALMSNSECTIQPFGTDAQRILRLEMGHPMLGHDTDGLTNPFEADVDYALKMQKPFFVGQRSLQILQKKPCIKKLVRFALIEQNDKDLLQECNLIIHQNEIVGRITSITNSPIYQKTIGFAYIKPEMSIIGTRFCVRSDRGMMIDAVVMGATFQ